MSTSAVRELTPHISEPGPVRNIRAKKVKEPKKRCGYGFYYSDYSDDADDEITDFNPAEPSVASLSAVKHSNVSEQRFTNNPGKSISLLSTKSKNRLVACLWSCFC